MGSRRKFDIDLLPNERAALLKWHYGPEVRAQLEARADDDVMSITVSRVELEWLIGDLNHAIVKKGCRDEDVIELSERLEYVERSGDGRLDIDY